MFRRSYRLVGLALALLAVVASARGQNPMVPVAPIQDQLPDMDLPQRLPFPEPPPPQPKLDVPISPNTGMPRLDAPAQKVTQIAEMAVLGNDYVDPRYVINSQRPDDTGLWERTRDGYFDTVHSIVKDYKRFYLSENLLYVGIAVGVAAPLANSSADQRLRDSYQSAISNNTYRDLDKLADGFKQFGEYKYGIPAYVILAGVGFMCPESPIFAPAGRFGDRSLRALAVGAPMVGVLQYGLGGARPFTGDSRWHPFTANNSASGHAFVGAVPFLTAASMVENRALKAALIVASLGPGWSRIHHDAHYFSQTVLGWSIAFLAVEAVNYTESDRLQLVPLDVPNGYGVGVQVVY